MKIQWHPASARRTVLSRELSPRRQTLAVSILFFAAAILVGAPLVVSTVLTRWRRGEAESEAESLNLRRKEALDLATSALRQTAARLTSDRALLGRIAYLYDLPGLAREASSLSESRQSDAGRLAATEAELEFLRSALKKLLDIEQKNPEWPSRTPSISPVPESAFVPTNTFGWTVSRLTREREFVPGLDLACLSGLSVVSPADGVVHWAGAFPIRPGSPYGHLGRIVAIRHGDRAVTLFGFLASVQVRKGQSVSRGEKVGTVGISPWVNAPRLRFEVWRLAAPAPFPIDPSLAMLNVTGPDVFDALRQALRGPARNVPELPSEFR
ncbi:MAG: M23 family metallopeptidase [Thermoanaerobaculia bacterium]